MEPSRPPHRVLLFVLVVVNGLLALLSPCGFGVGLESLVTRTSPLADRVAGAGTVASVLVGLWLLGGYVDVLQDRQPPVAWRWFWGVSAGWNGAFLCLGLFIYVVDSPSHLLPMAVSAPWALFVAGLSLFMLRRNPDSPTDP